MNSSTRNFWIAVLLLVLTIAASKLTERRIVESLAAPLESIPEAIDGWSILKTETLDTRTLQVLMPTSYLSRIYGKDGRQLGVFVAYYAVQRAGETMHSPKNCLPGSGWEIWRQDVLLALAWLRARTDGPLSLWGLRLGALLALDVAQERRDLASILLWQPVTEGAAYLTGFLRLRLAADMLAAANPAGDTGALRKALADGASLDIAGYTITPALAQALDGVSAAELAAPACPVHWLDLVPQAGRPMAPGRAAAAARLAGNGWTLDTGVVQGPAFWSTQEIAEAPTLLDASAALLLAEAG